MLLGEFVEFPTNQHVSPRRDVLCGDAVLPPPTVPTRAASTFDPTARETLRSDLRTHGLALVRLEEPLATEGFLALGAFLGTPMQETDSSVSPFTDSGVILNVVAEYGHTDDARLAPFATNHLSLHSESSGRGIDQQPRYIVLMCHDPGDAAARTVLVPMAEVAARLSAEHAAVLADTRYRDNDQAPFILREQNGRTVFSFRDFQDQPLAWAHRQDRRVETVNAALLGLLAAMYAPGIATGVRWERGLLAVIDNTFFFHGRTSGAAGAAARKRRLQRLRVR